MREVLPFLRWFSHGSFLKYIYRTVSLETEETEEEYRARIFKRVWGPRIDSKEWIPPAYVAWRAGTITLFLIGS